MQPPDSSDCCNLCTRSHKTPSPIVLIWCTLRFYQTANHPTNKNKHTIIDSQLIRFKLLLLLKLIILNTHITKHFNVHKKFALMRNFDNCFDNTMTCDWQQLKTLLQLSIKYLIFYWKLLLLNIDSDWWYNGLLYLILLLRSLKTNCFNWNKWLHFTFSVKVVFFVFFYWLSIKFNWNLTPKAENRFVLLRCFSPPRNTSDLGRGGRRGRNITMASSRISSSRSFESLDTESCRCTLSWSILVQSV